MEIYVVKSGDTVDLIAAYYDVSVDELVRINQLTPPYRLAIGQALLIPSKEKETDRPFIYVGGYAYPYIDSSVLEETLPFLSNLFVFSYGYTPEGEILPPPVDDTFMIELAKRYGTRPILTLAPIDESGNFNNLLIHQLLNNQEAIDTLTENLLNTVTDRGFEGVDLDFEYILAADREAYVAFVEHIQQAVATLGYQTSVALAPKTSANQRGILYEGLDYSGLGAAADHVLLMTYEWGFTFSEPRAVAPINEVRKVVEYAISVIPAEKINLGIPNYGYDWTLPFIPGQSRATAISLEYAITLAINHDVPIEFDEVAMSPHFTYFENGTQHEVWFEDVRSIREKLNLVLEYDLRGVSYWQILRFFYPNWVLLDNTFRIQKS
ncbi:MAG: LysM peptidoglycan-binding domain-containing protein [Lachnospiraceae bacterium]|nr:LysM peptidoglycan-binding domain-containing protein [Lachnospiraceae bacterium]